MGKPLPKISVDKLYYCDVLSDTELGVTYGSPVWLQGVNQISYNPNTQNASWDADGGAYDTYSAFGDIQTTITIADLEPAQYAHLMGAAYENGVIKEGANDSAPEVAIGFRAEKSNGGFRFVWVLKGKFSKQQEDYNTKGSSGITYNPRTIMHTGLLRTYDGMARHMLDSDDSNVSLTVAQLSDSANGWYSNPDFDPASYSAATPVSDLAASTGTNAGEITVAFTAPTSPTNIAIQVSTGSEWVTVKNMASGGSATLTGLVAGGEYLVRAVVTGGTNAGISNIDSATAHS